jgi:Cu-Zn family superoxide dismutase
MKPFIIGLSALAALAGCEREESAAPGGGATARATGELEARAELVDTQGKQVGTAMFRQEEMGVRITLDLRGLPPGAHAVHIHEKPECDGPDFKSAGEHFNPFGRKHGWLDAEGPHAGDLPNIRVKDDGAFRGSFLAPLVTLREGEHSLLRGGGTSIMIHAKPDDGATDPSGGAGDRIACGRIRKVSP